MTPTNEQLKLAAKAAGIAIHHWIGNEPRVVISEPNAKYEQYKRWLPVTDKSDSFDLRVAIDANIRVNGNYVLVNKGRHAAGVGFYEDHNNDKGLATMRAVFMCAVEIGRSL